MKRIYKIVIALAALTLLSLGAAACASSNPMNKYAKDGYEISVTYDPNGGAFLEREGVSIVDMFKSKNYQKDAEGKIHIKLMEPTSDLRPTSSSSSNVTLDKSGYFFAGWYKTREFVKNDAGNLINDNGEEIEITEENTYVIKGTTDVTYPACTYADMWNFETDTVDYSDGDGKIEMTLYAGWVAYYQFDYYCKVDGEWTLYGSTSFDYKAAKAEESFEDGTLWIPQWDEGAMNYTHGYGENKSFTFPKKDGTTFSKAYADEECTQLIESSIQHGGSLNLENCTAVNNIQKVYVELEEGERYRITTAKQFIDNPNVNGYYEIFDNLDFDGFTWPKRLEVGTFTGKIYSSDGTQRILSNISAEHSDARATVGGLFGSLAATAEISDVKFTNVTFDLKYAGTRLSDTSFGLFAGVIEEGATLTNVEVDGTFKMGAITLGNNFEINLFAGGDGQKLSSSKISFVVYGQKLINDYNYTVEPTKITIDEESGAVNFEFVSSSRHVEESFVIKQSEV